MTDKELVEKIATEVMGWQLCQFQYGSIPGNTKLSWINNGEREFLYEQFNPLQDANQCFMVLRRMTELGWGWAIEHTVVFEKRKVEIYRDQDWADANTVEEMQELDKRYRAEYFTSMDDLLRAINLAALSAVEGEKR